jgi:hypothetical protein
MSSIYLHPLAYLVGLEGVALMKAFAGEYDRDFTHTRLAEVKRLLDSPEIWGDGVEVPPMPSPDGYDGWSASYDDPGNGYFEMDRAVLLPGSTALHPAPPWTSPAAPDGTPPCWRRGATGSMASTPRRACSRGRRPRCRARTSRRRR